MYIFEIQATERRSKFRNTDNVSRAESQGMRSFEISCIHGERRKFICDPKIGFNCSNLFMFERKESELKYKFCDTDNASNAESEGCMVLMKFQQLWNNTNYLLPQKGAASRKEPVRSICTCLREKRRN